MTVTSNSPAANVSSAGTATAPVRPSKDAKVDAKVAEAIDSATKYVAKSPTSNLRDFHSFVRVTTGAIVGGGEKTKAERDAYERGYEAALRSTGLYSRYQDAKRDGSLEGILKLAK